MLCKVKEVKRRLVMWQFLCDSLYDLIHLRAKYGQGTLGGWWDTRKFEWRHYYPPKKR